MAISAARPTLPCNCSPSRALYSSTFDPITRYILVCFGLHLVEVAFFSDSGPVHGLLLVTALRWQRKNLPSVDFSLDNFRFKWHLWIRLIGCRLTPVVAICSSWRLSARCGRRSVPPKPPFPGCWGGTRLWVRRKRPLGIVAEPLWTWSAVVLK